MSTTRIPTSRNPTDRSPRRPGQRDAAPAQPAQRTLAGVIPLKRLFTAEHSNFYLLLGTTIFLVIFGLVMVLSASFVEAQAQGDDMWSVFVRQGLYAVIGVPLMLIASRVPIFSWKRWAWPAVLVGVGLQFLVVATPLGYSYGGNQNWLAIGGVTAQPSELVKLALILWIAWVLTTKRDLLDEWRHVALPIGPVAGVAIGFVLLGNDLGTAFIMLAIVLGALFFAGVRLKFLGVAVAGIGILGALFSLASPSRVSRLTAWFNGCSAEDYINNCWQIQHGTWALAAGGFFGVGLGNSKAKWSWLPEADNDFIFAIIGEELGLIGAIVVLLLFIVLAIAFVRIMRSSRDDFARIATSGVMIWVIGQAFVNIAVVLGVLPVLGVPLPLISAGGSALISTLVAIGVVLSFARNQGQTAPLPPVAQSPADRSRLAAMQRRGPQAQRTTRSTR